MFLYHYTICIGKEQIGWLIFVCKTNKGFQIVMIRLGYVCVNTLLPSASKSFRLGNYTEEKMLDYTNDNMNALQRILLWNVEHHITLFRITSALIPFGSHPINSGEWKYVHKEQFIRIGNFIRDNGIRVSMHPGQYSVLNSPDVNVYEQAVRELNYHNVIMDLMELDSSHKIIIHGGGVYNDKKNSMHLLVERILLLPEKLQRRLVIENDDRSYNAEDIYRICKDTGIPGIFDIFHHQCLSSFTEFDLNKIILLFKETWFSTERQKIHYSNQADGKNKGAHSDTIDLKQFAKFYQTIQSMELDIMLETKDKQNSVLLLRKVFRELQ
jgi:UV DNA damage endonuclease